MQFDREKLKTAILYTCLRCRASELGAVKLHKVLYYADMLHYLDAGAPMTGSTYRKRPLGPMCDQLLPTLRELSDSGHIRISDSEYYGYRKKEFTAVSAPDMNRLSDDARNLLDDVIDFVCRGNTAKTISDFSHSTPWQIVEFGDELPYHGVLHLIPNQVSLETFDWASDQAGAVEAERSKNNPLDYPVFATLRNRLQEGRPQ